MRKLDWAHSIAAGLLAFMAVAEPATAEQFVNTGYFGDVAIKGYDPVAFFALAPK